MRCTMDWICTQLFHLPQALIEPNNNNDDEEEGDQAEEFVSTALWIQHVVVQPTLVRLILIFSTSRLVEEIMFRIIPMGGSSEVTRVGCIGLLCFSMGLHQAQTRVWVTLRALRAQIRNDRYLIGRQLQNRVP